MQYKQMCRMALDVILHLEEPVAAADQQVDLRSAFNCEVASGDSFQWSSVVPPTEPAWHMVQCTVIRCRFT